MTRAGHSGAVPYFQFVRVHDIRFIKSLPYRMSVPIRERLQQLFDTRSSLHGSPFHSVAKVTAGSLTSANTSLDNNVQTSAALGARIDIEISAEKYCLAT